MVNSTRPYETGKTGTIITYSVNGEPVDVEIKQGGVAYVSWTTRNG